MRTGLYFCPDGQFFLHLIHNKMGDEFIHSRYIPFDGKIVSMMVSRRHEGGGSPGGKKSTFMSVDRGSYHPFTTSAYLVCQQDRFVLLILVLTRFYAEDGSAK